MKSVLLRVVNKPKNSPSQQSHSNNFHLFSKRLSGKEVRAAQRAKIANDSVRFQKIIGKLESLKQVFSGDID